jgi:hypothetical protein
MNLPKASQLRRKSELAEQERKRIETEVRIRTLEIERQKKEQETASRLEKAKQTKQYKQILKEALFAATDGKLLIELDMIGQALSQRLISDGFTIAKTREEIARVESDFDKTWSLQLLNPSAISGEDFQRLVEFLETRWLSPYLESEIRPNEIGKTVAEILGGYIDLLSQGRAKGLHERVRRLLDFDSDDRHAELLIADLFFDRQEYVERRSKLGMNICNLPLDVDEEREFFLILKKLSAALAMMQNAETENKRVLDQGMRKRLQTLGYLKSLDPNSFVMSWWDALFMSYVEPETFAEEVFWLSSEDGGVFLESVKTALTVAANLGRKSAAIDVAAGSAEFYVLSGISQLIVAQGYDLKIQHSKTGDSKIVITW